MWALSELLLHKESQLSFCPRRWFLLRHGWTCSQVLPLDRWTYSFGTSLNVLCETVI